MGSSLSYKIAVEELLGGPGIHRALPQIGPQHFTARILLLQLGSLQLWQIRI